MTLLETHPIRISTLAQEGTLRFSKGLQVQMLLDPVEMKDLLDHLGDFYFLLASKVCLKDELMFSKETFLALYTEYVEELKTSLVLDRKKYQAYFSSAIAASIQDVFAIEVSPDHYLLKPTKPLIQLQPFYMKWDPLLSQFVTKALSLDLMGFGIQFSFPQIYQSNKTFEMVEVYKDSSDKNVQLFKLIQRWAREYTRPTAFLIEGQRVNAPFRIGIKAHLWINDHQALKDSNLTVKVTS